MQNFDRLEGVALERLHQFGFEGRTTAGRAEGAVARGAPGAAGDLRELGRGQPPVLVAVELALGCERDVIDVEIETHADRVGRDQIVDIARLVQRDLRVARARRQRAEHDRRAAALPADQLGNRVDFLGREGDDRRAARLAGNLLLAGEGELGETRPADRVCARQELVDHRPQRRRAEHQRLLATAPVEHAIGEDVAALEIGSELRLVDGDERDVEIARHRLDGRNPVARIGGLDLLFAGDQRDRLAAGALDDLVVHLARQEPQRQADDPRRMTEHALDREVGLAGIGGSKNSSDAVSAGAGIAVG